MEENVERGMDVEGQRVHRCVETREEALRSLNDQISTDIRFRNGKTESQQTQSQLLSQNNTDFLSFFFF